MKKIFMTIIMALALMGCSAETSKELDPKKINPTAEPVSTPEQYHEPIPDDLGLEKEEEYDYVTEKNIAIDGREYTYIKYCVENNAVRIISLKTKEDVLIIPSSYKDKPVKMVGGEAGEESAGGDVWQNSIKNGLQKIIVEEGVEEIYEGTFAGIMAEEIVLPESLTSIGDSAFYKSKISKVTIKSKNATLGACSFNESSLKEIHLPAEYNGEIGYCCFAGSAIEKFKWPDYCSESRSKVGNNCFENCDNLREVIFPENQKHIYIEFGTFNDCELLKQLTFPASVKKITYEQATHADNYKKSVETLVFKGKNTELEGVKDFIGGGKLHYITVGKIVAPQGSKAIKFAKKALKVGTLPKAYMKKHIEYGDMPMDRYNNNRGTKFVSLEYIEK